MLDFLTKTPAKNADLFAKKAKKLKISDIENFYLKSMKSTDSFGLEYERLSLYKDTGAAANYNDIRKIIEHFCKLSGWKPVFDDSTLIGAISQDNSSISLEPGCQLEISLKPYKNISEIDLRLSKIVSVLDKIATAYNIMFLPYGINPTQSPDEIKLLNKSRYKIMNNYLPNCSKAELCKTMMRKTAGFQVNIDYKNKKDAYFKLKFFNLIHPIISGLCANSPFENGKITENKTNRVNVWLYTGEDRCNLFYKDIFLGGFRKFDNVFKNYINCVLDVPMVYIERNGENIPINGLITFREFLKDGFMEYTATMDDYILHQSLCFPDVRLKQYIEIRNHDANSTQFALMICALYKGLSQYSPEKLCSKFNYLKLDKLEEYYKKVVSLGLDFKVNNDKGAWEIAAELFNLARRKLSAKERLYLEPMIEILKSRKTPSDKIFEAKITDVKELISFLQL